jgi:asparagine synthase (glutamine-hydrolysing)
MNAQIGHRGPDDEGYYCDRGLSLGVRRLSIIDLVAGAQPMSSTHGSHHIVYNGELYNYRELRAELERAGVEFRTRSDTEVVVNAYAKLGASCVERFNGMFAFAIWDTAEQRLFIARDRFGIKPLCYSWDGETLVFASEMKAILASSLVPKEIDQQALWHYLTFRYVPAPYSMWRNIRKLPPAHTLTFDARQRTIELKRYWDLRFGPERNGNGDSAGYVGEFESRFLAAVRAQLAADVPVGVFLSGGLDSSAVVAAAIESRGGTIDTFSVGFRDQPDANELPFARQIAEHFGTKHHEVTLDLDEMLAVLPDLSWYADDPIGDPALVPLYYLSRLARESVKVALSGEGADEVMGGYDLEQVVRAWGKLATFQRWPEAARKTVPQSVLRMLGRDAAVARLERHNLPLSQRNHLVLPHMTRYFSSAEKCQLWPAAPGSMIDSDDIVRAQYAKAGTDSPLHQLLYVYCQDWLVEDLLMKADRMTMATSVELRVPFLDHTLADWIATLPSTAKVGPSSSGRLVTKYLLRRFCERRLPAAIVNRPKQGFPVPLTRWTRGALHPHISRALLGPSSVTASVFDRAALARLVAEAPQSAFAAQRAWLLFVLEHWMRRWL